MIQETRGMAYRDGLGRREVLYVKAWRVIASP
jgi:hypothetical protein